MSLDLTKVIAQVTGMVAGLRSGRQERDGRSRKAVGLLSSVPLDGLKKKVALSKTTWLVAEPVEKLDARHGLPAIPADYTVLATDGSHIDVDRNRQARCFLINVGAVMLRYGSKPDAVLESSPVVYANPEELVVASDDGLREVPIEGNLLGVKRSVEEMARLAQMAEGLPGDSTAIGVTDGTLLQWNLEAYPEFVAEKLLDGGYLRRLEQIRKWAGPRRFGLAGYISFPRSADVVNALRVALCPREAVDSDKCVSCATRECSQISGVLDRDLFDRLLEPAERSALFVSPSHIQKRYYRQKVHFFYLKVDEEIARIEVPQWVAEDSARLELVHALVVDQCRRGQGYPVALSEAHEKAVVTGADRENFWRLVEEAMVEERLPTSGSAKSLSKMRRWV